MENTPKIQSSVNVTDKQPHASLKFPQQLGDTSEQVNKQNSSKGATLVRSQYDDPKITQVSKSSEGSSNKVTLIYFNNINLL